MKPPACVREISCNRPDGHHSKGARLPSSYLLRKHTHTSDELYVWISGSLTLIAQDGTKTKFRGPAYISYPGNAPLHEIRCGNKEACLFYLRYSRPFDIKYRNRVVDLRPLWVRLGWISRSAVQVRATAPAFSKHRYTRPPRAVLW